MAAKRAMTAFNLAQLLTGTRNISFDMVVRTMYETGRHLNHEYRETSEGGLAKFYRRRRALRCGLWLLITAMPVPALPSLTPVGF